MSRYTAGQEEMLKEWNDKKKKQENEHKMKVFEVDIRRNQFEMERLEAEIKNLKAQMNILWAEVKPKASAHPVMVAHYLPPSLALTSLAEFPHSFY
jgi:hypothetical protein